jgi:hypothetical protein
MGSLRVLMLSLFFAAISLYPQASYSLQLPPADEFRLTLRELSGKAAASVPAGPSCTGEASLALPCRAVSLTLENIGTHIVRLSGLRCSEPQISIDRAEPNSSNGWWPISNVSSKCPGVRDLPWTNTVLRPGQKLTYSTRLISPGRDSDQTYPLSGNVTLRARWALQGCIDQNEQSDCLTPLMSYSSPASSIFLTSNTIDTTVVPITADLGPLSFSFEVSALPDGQRMPLPPNAVPVSDPMCPEGTRSAECVTFHYIIHNKGARPVRHGRLSCSGSDILPEYRSEAGTWTSLSELPWICNSNIYLERIIPAGGSIDGYFTLRHLTPGWNTNPLRAAGTYSLRFTFAPNVCVASPDGRFCLVHPKEQPVAVSPEVIVHATAALGKPYEYP